MLTVAILIGVILAGLMFLLWAVHLRTKNAAIVDAGWAAGLPIAAILAAWRLNGDLRGWLLAGMVTIWGARLCAHLLMARVIGHTEEGRYVELRRQWRTHLAAKFLIFFEGQALLNVVLSIPFLIASSDGGAIGAVQIAALLLWLMALTGEALADRQLETFKQQPNNHGRVCDVGLWRYSRHPNYFFEWLIWVSYALYAATSPGGWAAWIAPALILYFLLRVTGIPATEAQALRSRGDAYRRYQARTSAFVPWLPR
jgi:steroid 5-alpha reductase family enzyme